MLPFAKEKENAAYAILREPYITLKE